MKKLVYQAPEIKTKKIESEDLMVVGSTTAPGTGGSQEYSKEDDFYTFDTDFLNQ